MNEISLNLPEFNYRQAAKLTGYSVHYLRKLVMLKKIQHYKIGPMKDRVRFRISDLKEFMNIEKIEVKE